MRNLKSKVTLNVLANGASRACSILINFIQVPIALSYLGNEAFALWLVLVGSIQMLGLSDLGIGFSIQNEVSYALGKGNVSSIKSILGNSLYFFVFVSILILIGSFIFVNTANLSTLFKIQDTELSSGINTSFIIAAIGFSLNFPLSIFTRIATGMQEAWITNCTNLADQFLKLGVIVFLNIIHASFNTFLLTIVLIPIACNFTLAIIILRMLNFRIFPLPPLEFAKMRLLLSSGSQFVLPQLCSIFTNTVPQILLAGIIGTANISTFIITSKFSTALIQMHQMVFHPLWPAYAESFSRGDHNWIIGTFRNSLRNSTLIALFATLSFLIFSPTVIHVWTHGNVESPDILCRSTFAVWIFIMCIGNAVSPILNGIGHLRIQSIAGLIAITIAYITFNFFTSAFGATGAIIAITLPYLIIAIPLVTINAFSFINSLENKSRSFQ